MTSAAEPPHQPKVWYLARCVECVMDLPFPSEYQRDSWAGGHRAGGHTVRTLTERRWRDPDFHPLVAQRTEQRGPNATVAGSTPAGGTFTLHDLATEMERLTPYIEAAKVGSEHEHHDGWSLTWRQPGQTLCSCGEPITELLTGKPGPPD